MAHNAAKRLFIMVLVLLAASPAVAQQTVPITITPGDTTSAVVSDRQEVIVQFAIETPGYYTFRSAAPSGVTILGHTVSAVRGAEVVLFQDLPSTEFRRFSDLFLVPGDYSITISVPQRGRTIDVSLQATAGTLLGPGRSETYLLTLTADGEPADLPLTLVADELITVRAAAFAVGLNPAMELRTSDGISRAANNSLPGRGNTADFGLQQNDSLIANFVPLMADEATLRVNALSGAGEVLVVVTRHGLLVPPPTQDEPSVLPAVAGELNIYTLDVVAGELLQISILGLPEQPGLSDPTLLVRNASEFAVARNDGPLQALDPSAPERRVAYFATTDETLTVVLSSFSSAVLPDLALSVTRGGVLQPYTQDAQD